jgi:hypothetical protein
MKQATNKQLRETLATIVAELNYVLNRVDATLSAAHVLKQFMDDNPEKLALSRDGVHGLAFLMLDTLGELEKLRDDARNVLTRGMQ